MRRPRSAWVRGKDLESDDPRLPEQANVGIVMFDVATKMIACYPKAGKSTDEMKRALLK